MILLGALELQNQAFYKVNDRENIWWCVTFKEKHIFHILPSYFDNCPIFDISYYLEN